jgi:DMSO/TMAO reductase YedYZ heme-binding membrane subunit
MSTLPWDVARAGGLVAYTLLASTVLWGTSVALRAFRTRPGLPWMNAMHEWLGVLTLVFIGVHVAGLLTDTYVRFSVVDVLVPFASSWHPGAVAWGVVSFYLLLAVHLSARLRRRVPRRYRHWWKRVHLAAYPLFATSTVHLLTTGTDHRDVLVALAVAGLVTAVLLGLTIRLTANPQTRAAT